MTSTTPSLEARELSLISKVELRIALADSDTKLQSLLQTYLAPLLLKLDSPSTAVKQKIVSVCQHINTRIQSPDIQLPIHALLKQFKEVKGSAVRHFDLIYIKQGLDRITPSERVALLPSLIQGIAEIEGDTQPSTIFNLVLRLLPLLKLPQKGSEEDLSLRVKLGITAEDAAFLCKWFGKLLLLYPGGQGARNCAALTPEEYSFVNKGASPSETWDPSAAGGLNLTETKVAVAKFLASGAFNNEERLFPAIFASADTNSRLSDIGDDILKRFEPDLEDVKVVDGLFSLYFGTRGADGAPPARPPLQMKILGLLSKSVKATAQTQRIKQLVEEGIISNSNVALAGLEATKLRNQIFNFITWVARMGSSANLSTIAPTAIEGLQEFIRLQGWPSPELSNHTLSAAEISLRSLAYETIGLLAPKLDHGLLDDAGSSFELGLTRWLFTSLSCDSCSGQVFLSIDQALGGVLNSVSQHPDESLQHELRPLLTQHMQLKEGTEEPASGFRVVRSSRFAAVRFANRCLPFGDVQARWIDLMAVGGISGEKPELADEGQKGLDPYWYRMLNPQKDGPWAASTLASSDEDSRYKFPRFPELVEELFTQSSEEIEIDNEDVPVPAKFHGTYINSLAPAVTFARNILVCAALVSLGTALDVDQDWEHRLDSIISSQDDARLALKEYLRQCGSQPVVNYMKAALSGLLGNNGKGLGRCGELFVEVSSLASNELLAPIAIYASFLTDTILSNNLSSQDVAARIFGILASHPSYPSEEREKLLLSYINMLTGWADAIGQEANRVRGSLLSFTYLLTRLSFRGELGRVPDTVVQKLVGLVFEVLENTRDLMLKEAAQTAIGQLSLATILSPEILGNNELGEKVIRILVDDAKKEKEIAVSTLGRLSLILPKDGEASSLFNQLLKALYGLHEVRRPEVQFAVGEALCTVAVGWASKSLITAFDVDAAWPQTNTPSHILSEMLEKIITDCKASKPSLRKASAIWLLCLIQYCGHFQEVQNQLRKCQAIFVWLLSDRDEVVQETASRGLSLVYEMGTQDLKDDLVRDLVRSFTTDKSNLGGGKISTDTELFEPGALPTGDGSVTTYKDIVGLASEVGDPSLVYRFMSLASNNAIWSSRAAFGRFGLSNVLSDSNVNGYLAQNPKLYPKLFRYRFDPNPNVQRSMNDIWNALVKDSNAVIEANFDAIMEDLLRSILAGKEWRVREASCAAIGELIQGRPVEVYDKFLSEILTKAFKVLDDIKGSVRQAALRLCQVLSNTVIRALEAGSQNSKRATTMLSHIIPFLLGQEGMESAAEEVQGYALATLTKIIKKSPAQTLRPFVPEILEKFLASLSSLEPQAVNYVHLNADKYGLTGQDIDKLRLSAIRKSPMMEAIELYLLDALDDTSMGEVAVKLENVLRSAIGLPSKVGVSRVLVILTSKTFLFRPHADRFIKLMRKYVLDRNETVSASYSSTMGYLARLASPEQMLATIEFTKSMYFNADETSHRLVSGEIIYHISKLANDRFMEFGAAVLPFVFVGMHDTDDHVKEFFEKTWNDNVSGSRSIALYLAEILNLVAGNLESQRWAVKHTSALAIAKVVSSLHDSVDLASAERIWPTLEKAVAGKTWEGKENVLAGFVSFCNGTKSLWAERSDIREQAKVIIIREAKRNNPVYRPHAIRALGRFAKSWDDMDLMPDCLDIVTQIVDQIADESEDKMDIDSGNKSTFKLGEQTLEAAIECIFGCLNPLVPATALVNYVTQLIPIVKKAVANGGKAIHGTAYDGIKLLFDRSNDKMSAIQEKYEGQNLKDFEAAISLVADGLLFTDIDLGIESSRSKRAQAALSLSAISEKSLGGLSVSHRGAIAGWLAAERSGQVQTILRQALGKP
ncbi:hypothetical protein AJ80_05787 [Polytolypa hystricis UAMH7299]|uniref:Proteasome component ECM29 n=1 Tax=Polytolypa hystricis (strain UAMH7299) TaxID=1447883 RepID=A0A2B7Y1E3_POLH7|nr:hypothetical protein AJ80_05787 [Polytolypa hystricis UAMH7299]